MADTTLPYWRFIAHYQKKISKQANTAIKALDTLHAVLNELDSVKNKIYCTPLTWFGEPVLFAQFDLYQGTKHLCALLRHESTSFPDLRETILDTLEMYTTYRRGTHSYRYLTEMVLPAEDPHLCQVVLSYINQQDVWDDQD